MRKNVIYADHAATTALSPVALSAMQPWLQDQFGNPSTLYSLARAPRKAVLAARESIALAIGAQPSEIIFTSGGSESDNLAIKGVAFKYLGERKHLIASAIEHHAILHAFDALERYGFSVGILPANGEGIISVDDLSKELNNETALVSIMLANNEIGTIEPVQALAEAVHKNGTLFHTDAVQAVGHIPVDVNALGVDLLSASAHKFNGPKGVGFLYVRNGVVLEPLIHGGRQENGVRAGTENVAGIVGMAAALREHIDHMDEEWKHLRLLQKVLVDALRAADLVFIVNGSSHRIPGNLSLSFANVSGEMLLHRLDLMGISVATGSACDSKETEVSHVIRAIGVPPEYALGTVRVSFGPENTVEDANQVAQCLRKIICRDQ